MDEMWVRRLCDAALADEPPSGPIARNSLRAGIALRRRRRARGALVSGVAVIAVAAAIPAVNQVVSGRGTMPRVSSGPTSAPTAGALPQGASLGRRLDWPWALAFSPSGKILVTVDADGTVRFWSVATRRQVGAPIRPSPARVEGVAFSPDGTTLATADYDGTVRLWNVATRHQVGAPIKVSPVQVVSVAFSPDGKLLATGGIGGHARLWNIATRQQVGAAMFSGWAVLRSVTFSPNGKFLATLGDIGNSGDVGPVRLWDVATQRLIGSPRTLGMVQGLAFSPDSKILALVGDGVSGLFNVVTLHQIAKLPGYTFAYGVAFSPNGQILIVAGTTGTNNNGTIQQWSVATHRQVRPPIVARNHPDLALAALSPDGKILATTQLGGPVLLWSLAER